MAKKSFDIKIAAKDNKDILTSVGEFTQANKALHVLPELENFITPLSREAFAQLEENILEEGIREPLIVWVNGDREILVDGHNRFQIAQTHDLPYKRTRKGFKGLEEVKKWMIQNQLGRRNLTDLELSYFRGLLYNQKKQGWGGKRDAEGTTVKTARLIADEYKVNERTILRDERLYQGIENIGRKNPELKRQVLSGDVKIPKSKIQKLAEIDEIHEIDALSDLIHYFEATALAVQGPTKTELSELVKSMKAILQDIAKTGSSQKVESLEVSLKKLKALLADTGN